MELEAIPNLQGAVVSPDEVKHARKVADEAIRKEAMEAIKKGLVPPLAKMSPALIDNIWLPLEAELGYAQRNLYYSLHGPEKTKDSKPYAPDSYTLNFVIPQQKERVQALKEKCEPYRAEWVKRGGWQRWEKVMNGNGHVHTDRSCKTCFPDTQWGIVPDLSGLNAKEMVEEVGEMACTVCFPWAPVTQGWARTVAEREDLKRAGQMEKQRKVAEKEAKAIYAADGSQLKDPNGWVIATVATAWKELVGAMDWLGYPTYEGNPYIKQYQDFIPRATAALAAKTGLTEAEITAEAQRKLAARQKRQR